MLTFFRRSRSSGIGNKGFTLIELLVVVSIMLILTSAFLLQQRRFNSSTIMRSTAYGIALSIRQAQVYATGVRQFGNSFTAKSYGVYFDDSAGWKNRYALFADTVNDGIRDIGGTEDVTQYPIRSGYEILRFCGVLSGGGERCSDSSLSPNMTSLNIYFTRPNTDAFFKSNISTDAYTSVYVVLKGINSTDGRRITVYPTGQISVGNLEQF